MKTILNSKIKKQTLWFFISILIVFASCKNSETKNTEAPLKRVKYAVVDFKDGLTQKTFSGETQSAVTTNLSFRMGGLIIAMNAKVGNKVKKGELLAELDTSDIDLSVQQINEAVQASKVQLETAKSTLDRTKRLYQSQGASLGDLENAKNNYAQANASYESNLKSLSLQKSQYSYAKIIAPNSGIISKVNAEQNEVVKSGNNIITVDSDNGEFQVKVSLPENYISEVKLNDVVSLLINGDSKEGVISEIGYASQGASFPVIINIKNPDSYLRPGLSASATFKIGSETQDSILMLPIEAVRQDATVNYVYQLVLQENKAYKVIKTPVQIGKISGDYFNVVSGVSKDDFIAVAGLDKLYEGMLVQLFKN